MNLNNLNLSVKLRIAFLVVPVLLIIVITIYAGINLTSSKNQLKKAVATQTSQSVIEKIDRNFYERFGDVQAYAVNRLALEMAQHDSVSTQAQTFINTMVSYYVLYDLMMIVNSEGKVVACNTSDKNGGKLQTGYLLGKDFSKTEWFKICTSGNGPTGGAWYSDFIVNPDVARMYENKGWGMAFAAPIKDDEGNVKGIWYNFASWKEVTQGIRQEALLSLEKSEPGSQIFILNETNQIIDASDEKLVLHKGLNPNSFEKETTAIISEGNTINSGEYTFGLALSTGAYTFKGKKWKCITVIPKANLSFAHFFSLDLMIIDIILLAFATLVAHIVSKHLIQKIYQLQNIVNKLSIGNLAGGNLNLQGNDELTQMGKSIETLADGLRQTSTFAQEIGKGNFEVRFTPLSNNDTLGNALIQMSTNLKIASEEDKRRNWTTEGLARFADVLRSHAQIHTLAEQVIANLVKYLDANQGGLFILNDTNVTNIHLELVACYAFDKKKYIERFVHPGEGLLGQAFLEKATVYRTDIPQNYMKITSGLGEANPGCLLIVPLKVNEKVEGVVEIASFNKFEPYQIAFVEKLAENIASSISVVKVNEVTRKLLDESQGQAEQMRAQEEEMRQNMEELMATQEEMHRKENEYLQLIKQLKNDAAIK